MSLNVLITHVIVFKVLIHTPTLLMLFSSWYYVLFVFSLHLLLISSLHFIVT
jgi:hypothetical protein